MKKETIKKFFNNGWTMGIGIPIILSVFGFITFDIVKKLFITVGSFIIHIFTVEVRLPVWGFILSIISIPLLFIAGVLIFRKVPQEEIIPFLKYTKDFFGKLEYRWEYQKTYNNKYNIQNIRRHCPKCSCLIRVDRYGSAEDCLNCGYKASNVKAYTDDEVHMLVTQRIEQKAIL